MPSLKYYDQAAGSYKYVVGGLNQDTADARYLLSGFRNVIRNGDMSIAQRGNGAFAASTGVGIDGWGVYKIGSGTGAHSRVAQAGESSWHQTVVAGTSAAADRVNAYHNIEDVTTLSGQTVTLSLYAKAASGTPKIGVELYFIHGSGGAADVSLPVGTITLSTTKTRYFLTFTMPSTAGKVIGAGNVVQLIFYYSAGSDWSTRASNIGIQNNTFSITDVQLEAGPVATPFERLPVQQQLAWCQRYFWRMGTGNPHLLGGTAYSRFGVGQAQSTTVASVPIQLPVAMRANPTNSCSAPGTFMVLNAGGAGQTVTAISADTQNPAIFSFAATVASGLVAGNAATLISNAGQAAYLDFSAEL